MKIGEPPKNFDRVAFLIVAFGLACYIGWLALVALQKWGA